MAIYRDNSRKGAAVNNDAMRHIDLFSGIGGFALAAREVWGKEYENVLFCDNNKFCQQVIKKNFGKDSVIYEDIREVTADSANSRLKKVRQERQDEIFLLTGGFPCQPFSQAGKRRGTSDNRYLWPEMLRVIREFQPTWVVAENVRGLLTISEGLVFEQVCLDLEREGYEVQAFVIPAVAVNAPHRRDRVWLVAHRKGIGVGGSTGQECGIQERALQQGEPAGCEIRREGEGCVSNAHDTINEELERHPKPNQGQTGRENKVRPNASPDWSRNWLEVATKLCRVDDGLPVELDGFKLTKAGHRVERLKALGNAIVPQVAIEIMKAIKETT